MMASIKPIETVYNGYRFRSRLEARWAVFFDVLDVKYEYESEGYDLGILGWYLPDFWLPQAKWHIEIKPLGASDDDLKKAHYFDMHAPAPSMGVIILRGQPEAPTRFYDHGIPDMTRDNCPCGVIFWSMQCLNHTLYDLEVQRKILRAIQIARSVRFEHGETPKWNDYA